jgi:hypothetical protein
MRTFSPDARQSEVKLRWKIFLLVTVLLLAGGAIFLARADQNSGALLDTYEGVAIYDNGPLAYKAHGKHFSPTGYYWGQKWQCVEFVKRFYDVAKHHQMPEVYGHAKDFFDETLAQGALNKKRGLLQFHNGGNMAPRVDDLLVFSGTYGHVAIVSEVGSNFVEVVQQNIYKKPRARFELISTNKNFRIGANNLLGWLRAP